MGSVRVAIVGVGNCAASLVQGVEYYKDADPASKVPCLMHVQFGDYHVGDVEFVAAFDVDAKKVGLDLSDAIGASENNTIKICEVETDLLRVDVEGSHELDVPHVVIAELDVHQTRHPALRVGVLVVLDALHQRGGAVSYADDGYANRTHSACSLCVISVS